MNLFPYTLSEIYLTEVYGLDTFLRAFVTMFNVITLNNWTIVLVIANSVHSDYYLCPFVTSTILVS